VEQIRQELGLEPISTELTVDASSAEVPLWRLARLDTAATATPQLIGLFVLAMRCRLLAAEERIGEELLNRIDAGEDIDFPADRIHFVLGTAATDLSVALQRLQNAESTAIKMGRSPAEYLLHELILHLRAPQQDNARFQRVLQLLTTRYSQEPGVMDQLRMILYQAGLITADGRPVTAAPTTSSSVVVGPMAEPAASVVVDAPPAPQEAPPAPPSKLWLPGQD
jgi:hypothetical protein